MKNKSTSPSARHDLRDEEIRDYAYHLYQQSNSAPGHDLDNWLEASACLRANIPAGLSRSRLHQHVNGPDKNDRFSLSVEARSLAR
jgi:hypothetical protein